MTSKLHAFEDLLGARLGCRPEDRIAIVRGMMQRDPRESIAYWLQLIVALGIATLGLVLSSSAVVIGAMLIAPLMAPIVSLGMGLSVGSPYLVLRSSGRITLSVAVVIGGAALLTMVLPFQELTPEIAARTNPTLLDLLTAAFCAIAGAYAALRPGSATVTAAGTSIGISLVPPLCASGYGLGVGNAAVAKGAALLFTANLAAIVVVATVAFILTGFSRTPVAAIEIEELAHDGNTPISRAAARLLARVFASAGGPLMRMLLPFALLALVYLPLSRALDEVVWQVRARKQVQGAVEKLSMPLVQSHLRVERRTIELRLILLGGADDAERVEAQLTRQVRAATGIAPRVQIAVVPDASALARAAAEDSLENAAAAPVIASVPFVDYQNGLRDRLQTALTGSWPERAAGAPVSVWTEMGTGSTLNVFVLHRGASLGSAAHEVLARALSGALGTAVRVSTLSLTTSDSLSGPEQTVDVARRIAARWEHARWIPGALLCIVAPQADDAGASTGTAAVRELRALLGEQPGRVIWQAGDTLQASIGFRTCEERAAGAGLVPVATGAEGDAGAAPARDR